MIDYIEYTFMEFSECHYRTIDYAFLEQATCVVQMEVGSEH